MCSLVALNPLGLLTHNHVSMTKSINQQSFKICKVQMLSGNIREHFLSENCLVKIGHDYLFARNIYLK